MASAGQMAEFFATLGFKVDKADIKKVDKTLDHIENRIKKVVEGDLSNLKVNISGFRFTNGFNTRLYKAMQKKMSMLNNKKGLSPEITVSKFDIDKTALLRETRAAVDYVENNIRMRIRTDVGRPQMDGRGGMRQTGGVSRFGTGMGVGAAAGSLGRGFIPGLGLAFGVSQMNQLNQQLIGQGLAATAVFGNQEAGQEQLDWVRNLGNKIGFDYRSQANPYMKMAAAGKTAGMSTGDVQEIFTGMAEYGRVMGLNDEDMKGSMRAVEQMLNKGQVYAEELKMQLGEKFPAAIQLMAEAVAGGDTEKLFDMMEKGEVSSIEALPKFAKILSRQARVGGALTEAMKTSLAEQMRFNNTFNDLVMFMSEAGFEEGQAGIFRTMADFFMEMKPLLAAFGEAWRYMSNVLRVPLGLLVDVGRAIEWLSERTGIAKGTLFAFGGIIAGLVFPFTRVLTAIGLALTALEDFTAFLTGRGSVIGHLLGDDSEQVRQQFISIFETSVTLVETLIARVKDLFSILNNNVEFAFVDELKEFLADFNRFLDDLNVLLGGRTRGQRDAISSLDEQIANTDNATIKNDLINRRRQLINEADSASYMSNFHEQILGGAGVGDSLRNAMPFKLSGGGLLGGYIEGTNAMESSLMNFLQSIPDKLRADEEDRGARFQEQFLDYRGGNNQSSTTNKNEFNISMSLTGNLGNPDDIERNAEMLSSAIARNIRDKTGSPVV